jgi:hypothetical protein
VERPTRRNSVDRPLLIAVVAIHVLAVAKPVDVLFPVDAWSVGRMLLHGAVPYRDFQFEYPPLSALAFVLPGLVPRGAAATVLALQAVGLELLAVAYIRAQEGAVRRYAALSFLLFPFLAGGFDAFPMAALAVSTALLAGGSAAGWGVVAAGAMMKISPGVAWVWCRRHLGVAAGALAVTLAVVLAPVALARHRDDDWLTYNLHRGVQVESVAATTTWLARHVNGRPSTYEYRYKAFEIDHASLEAAAWVAVGALGMVWIAVRARGRDAWALALLAVDLFLVASKVLSPQYFAWTAPLAAVVGGRVYLLHLAMAGLTVVAYSVVSGSEAILTVAAIRNVVLVGTVAWGLWQLRIPPPPPAKDPATRPA